MTLEQREAGESGHIADHNEIANILNAGGPATTIVRDESGGTISSGDFEVFPLASPDGWTVDRDDLNITESVTYGYMVVFPVGLVLVGGYFDFANSPLAGSIALRVEYGGTGFPVPGLSYYPDIDYNTVEGQVPVPTMMMLGDGSPVSLALKNRDVGAGIDWDTACMWVVKLGD